MGRFIRFCLCAAVSAFLVWNLTPMRRYAVDWLSFGIGLGVAAGTSLVFFLVNGWWRAARQPFQPQRVEHFTARTPNQIAREAAVATLMLLLFIAAVVAFFVWLLRQ